MAISLKASILHSLKQLKPLSIDQVLDRRYEKFRRIGMFEEQAAAELAAEAG
jgi:acetyl-CoA carboxylase carboxyl transferase subunit alpha